MELVSLGCYQGNDLELLVHQVDASLRAETSETTGQFDAHISRLQQRLGHLQQEVKHGQAEVKDVLKNISTRSIF